MGVSGDKTAVLMSCRSVCVSSERFVSLNFHQITLSPWIIGTIATVFIKAGVHKQAV